MRSAIALLLLSGFVAGCPLVPPETRHPHIDVQEPVTGAQYWLYAPSYYSSDRDWPLVVTLHGTEPWDGRTRQVMEWKDTAERQGLIVIAPALASTQGPVPVIPSVWRVDKEALARDERVILACIDHVGQTHRIDAGSVLLTGFSSGGFPLYYIGLRNPARFSMLIARDCNSTMDILRSAPVTDEVRKLPIVIFWGRDDLETIRAQSWEAFRYLRENGCWGTQRKEIAGGHLRRPDIAYQVWSPRLPKRHRR